jgi:ABC-2 type transport system ATP-binding protein
VTLIETRSLTKRYANSVTALDDLNITVEPGVIGLVGANGAGKSTMIKILLGLLEPTSGAARVLDLDPQADGARVRALVGYMPEHDCLPPDVSATEFVTHMGRMSGLPPTAARERAADTLRHVGLHEERYRLIGGYSTGMKQRVKLAQALVHDPKLLLLDEPTNGLDPAGRDAMLVLIREIERICGSLVAIEGGRLLRSAALTSFTERSDLLAVEVEEGTEELAGALAAHGLVPKQEGRALVIPLTGDIVYDVIRDTVAELGLPLHRLEQRRHRVEELFRDETAAGEAARVR